MATLLSLSRSSDSHAVGVWKGTLGEIDAIRVLDDTYMQDFLVEVSWKCIPMESMAPELIARSLSRRLLCYFIQPGGKSDEPRVIRVNRAVHDSSPYQVSVGKSV